MSISVRIAAFFVMTLVASTLAGCPPRPVPPVEAISLSNTQLNFELNTNPIPVQVWNNNVGLPTITILVNSNMNWLKHDVATVTSAAPAGGNLDRQTIQVSVNRTQLPVAPAGTVHQATLKFTSSGVITKTLTVSVTNDGRSPGQTMTIVNPVLTYTDPFLVDMHFSLKDSQGHSVVAEPVQFELTAQEGATAVDPLLNGLQIKRAAARQLKANLVLDYSLGMQSVQGAIAAMQDAATNILLPALNEDAQVGVWEFHRDDREPQQVVPFTIGRAYLTQQIRGIQQNFVNGFFSGARVWDALLSATLDFSSGNPQEESRFLILFSNGNDTSSVATQNTVVSAARARGVRIYAVAFGNNVNVPALQDITQRTDGRYFPTQSVDQVDDAFDEIVRDLDGQYNVRWASLKRGSAGFLPTVNLTLGNDEVTFTPSLQFVPNTYAGDPLRGVLRLDSSSDLQTTTAFLRAVYVPRFITELHVLVTTFEPFTVQLVGPGNDGVTAGWTMVTENDSETGGTWIHLESPGNAALPFATFGPILRFTFNTLADSPAELFETVTVDNTVYPNQQFFVVEDFE